MNKTEKELAFLRDLSVDADWTGRFTETFDKTYKFKKEESVLYLNAGTGNHVLALREKLKDKIEIFGVTENEELTIIAAAKAKAMRADVEFSSFPPSERYDLVIANATLVSPLKLEQFVAESISLSDWRVVFFLPTAGSFGEIFSMLWETFLNADMMERSGAIERLIAEIPTVSQIEEWAKREGLREFKTDTSIEVFEYDTGEDFINSTFISEFLLPGWFDYLDDGERAKFYSELERTINENRDEMSFRVTVKATMLGGEIA